MKFEEEERIAFARVISDLIEADFVLEESEMKSFDDVIKGKEFRLSPKMLSAAKRKSFAEAIRVLQNIKDAQKKELIKESLFKVSLSDGTCAPLEALQIMSVKYAIEGKAQVFSIPEGSSFIENMKVIYIENEDNTETDSYIHSHYRAISNEFRLAGFDFVYIPNIAEDYKKIRGDYLRKVITYMMPLVSESKVEKIQQDLCSMTTSRFCFELLYKKMGINILNSKPAFLFKIGESSVADKCGVDDMERNIHSNYLLIPIEKMREAEGKNDYKNVLKSVAKVMDTYKTMVSGNLIIETHPLSHKFIYYGFHRSLFDLIAYGKDKTDYKLVINLKNRTNPVLLRPNHIEKGQKRCDNEDLPIDLNTQPYTLYILMVNLSLKGRGLDWKNYTGKNPAKELILEKYNAIYRVIGKGNTNIDYRDKSHVSRIKKSLRSHEKLISNIDLFIPEKIVDAKGVFYNVPIPPDLVYVIEGEKGKEKEVRMIDSDFWKTF